MKSETIRRNVYHRLGNLKDNWLSYSFLILSLIFFIIFLAAPLLAILSQIFPNGEVNYYHFSLLIQFINSPSLQTSLSNSIFVATTVTVIIIPLAFIFAYGITRRYVPFKNLLRNITLLPLLAPSLLSAISLIYWFGNHGVAKEFWQSLGFENIYGPGGIILAECFAIFPHVLMILVTSLSLIDKRLFEAAASMKTTKFRQFTTITLPSIKYGLISAYLLSFTLVITDFGIPKIVGGNYNVLATDVFRLIVGQQNFQQGAAVALVLLFPTPLTFTIDFLSEKKQANTFSSKAVVLDPTPQPHDNLFFLYCVFICTLMLLIFVMAIFASLVHFWPYDLSLSLSNYQSVLIKSDLGDTPINNLIMALGTTLIGTSLVFCCTYILEKTQGAHFLRIIIRILTILPMTIPGLVLGLGYIFFFNNPNNPLSNLYQTMAPLILCTVVHFYTTGYMTMSTALKNLDPEFEDIALSLKVPFYKTMWKITLPLCLPTLLDISRYFFINAMTTISAVVFLYSPEIRPASITILNLYDAGDIGAAAMAVLITLISVIVTGVYLLVGQFLQTKTQQWRQI